MALIRSALVILAAVLNSAAAVKHGTWGRAHNGSHSSDGQMRVHVGPSGDVLDSVVTAVGLEHGSSDSQASMQVRPAGAVFDAAIPDPTEPHGTMLGSGDGPHSAAISSNNNSSRGSGTSMLRREGSSVGLLGGRASLTKDSPGDGAESTTPTTASSDGSHGGGAEAATPMPPPLDDSYMLDNSSLSAGGGTEAALPTLPPLEDSHPPDSSSPASGGSADGVSPPPLPDPFADSQGSGSTATVPEDSPLAPLQEKYGKQEPLPKDNAPVQIPFLDHDAELMRSDFPAFEKVLAHHEEQPVEFTGAILGALQHVEDAEFADQVITRHLVEHEILDGMAHHVSEKGAAAPPADDPLLWHTLKDVEGTLYEREGETRHKVIEQFAKAIVESSASSSSSTGLSSHNHDDVGADLDKLVPEDVNGPHDGFHSKLDDALGSPSDGFKELMNHSPDWFAPSASDAYVPSFEHSLDGAERKSMDSVKGLWGTLDTLYQNLTEYDRETRGLVGHELAHAINYSLDDGNTVMFHALGEVAETLHERDSQARDMVQKGIIDEVFGKHVPLPDEEFNVTEALREIDLPLPEAHVKEEAEEQTEKKESKETDLENKTSEQTEDAEASTAGEQPPKLDGDIPDEKSAPYPLSHKAHDTDVSSAASTAVASTTEEGGGEEEPAKEESHETEKEDEKEEEKKDEEKGENEEEQKKESHEEGEKEEQKEDHEEGEKEEKENHEEGEKEEENAEAEVEGEKKHEEKEKTDDTTERTEDHYDHDKEKKEIQHADTSKEKAGEGTTTTTTVKKSGASRTWDTKRWQLRICLLPFALMPLIGPS